MKTKTKEKIVDSSRVNNIDYDKPGFKKGLYAVKEKISVSRSLKSVDDTKLHYTFSI